MKKYMFLFSIFLFGAVFNAYSSMQQLEGYAEHLRNACELTEGRLAALEDRLAFFQELKEKTQTIGTDKNFKEIYMLLGGNATSSASTVKQQTELTINANILILSNNINGMKVYTKNINSLNELYTSLRGSSHASLRDMEGIATDLLSRINSMIHTCIVGRSISLNCRLKRVEEAQQKHLSFFSEFYSRYTLLEQRQIDSNLGAYEYEAEYLKELSAYLTPQQISEIFQTAVTSYHLYFKTLQSYITEQIDTMPNPDLTVIDYFLSIIDVAKEKAVELERDIERINGNIAITEKQKRSAQRLKTLNELQKKLKTTQEELQGLKKYTADEPIYIKHKIQALEVLDGAGLMTREERAELDRLRQAMSLWEKEERATVADEAACEEKETISEPSSVSTTSKKKKGKPNKKATAQQLPVEQVSDVEEVTAASIPASEENTPVFAVCNTTTIGENISDDEEEEVAQAASSDHVLTPNEQEEMESMLASRYAEDRKAKTQKGKSSPDPKESLAEELQERASLKSSARSLIEKFWNPTTRWLSWDDFGRIAGYFPGYKGIKSKKGSIYTVSIANSFFNIHKPHAPVHDIGTSGLKYLKKLLGNRFGITESTMLSSK